MRASAAWVLLATLSSCASQDPSVICHNANCVEPTDPAQDDTPASLSASLALRYQDRPVLDGVEIDLFWRGEDDQCIFAHDLLHPKVLVPASEPAAVVAAYFATPGPIGWHDDRDFEVLLELKGAVTAPPIKQHSAAQRVAHAACAWQTYQTIANAALAHGRRIRVTFSSFAPTLLQAVHDAAPTTPAVPFRLLALQGLNALDAQTRGLNEFGDLPIEAVAFHGQWITDTQQQAFVTLGLELSLYMFDATTETFAAIRRYRPAWVITSEARLLRRWVSNELQ